MPTKTETTKCAAFPGTHWETTVDGRSVIVRLMGKSDGKGDYEICMRRRLYADGLTKPTGEEDDDGNPISAVSPLDPFDLTARLMREIVFEVRSYARRR